MNNDLIFILDCEIVDRDDLGDPIFYEFLVDGVWKTDDELTVEDLDTLYSSGNKEVFLRSISPF